MTSYEKKLLFVPITKGLILLIGLKLVVMHVQRQDAMEARQS